MCPETAGVRLARRNSQVCATPLPYCGRLYVKGETEPFCCDVSAGAD
jgi:hypothetical protein